MGTNLIFLPTSVYKDSTTYNVTKFKTINISLQNYRLPMRDYLETESMDKKKRKPGHL